MNATRIRSAWETCRRPPVRMARRLWRSGNTAWRSSTRPLRRAAKHARQGLRLRARRYNRNLRHLWKVTGRYARVAWSWLRHVGRHSRLRLWRYTLHFPLRWAKKYGWWRAYKVYRNVVTKVYRWYGTRVLRTLAVAHALLFRATALGVARWQATLFFNRFTWMQLPRLPPKASPGPGLYREARGIHLKERGRSYEQSFQGPWGRLRAQQALEEGNQKKRLMWEAYTRVSKPVMLNVPFVYVALHFQPERTTSSLGGPFADQYLLVDLVARCVPRGWKVYVKEHPSQFYPPFCGERSRHLDFYTDLQRVPNVELVSLSTSSFQLIDHARAVATVTGTVGWEAVIRGTPALVFGSPWYRHCEGVWCVATEKALREALTWIEAGVRPDYRKVRLFMLALDSACARAGLGYGTPDEVELGLPHDETVARLSDLLYRCWKRMERTPPRVAPQGSLPPLPFARTRADVLET